MLTITKEYLIYYTDETALPVGLVYDYTDIMVMFNIAKTKASYILKAIKQGQPFSVDGVEYDSVEIKEDYNE